MSLELTFIPAILLILLAAGIGRLISLKTNQPRILGELVLGIIFGSFVTIAPSAQPPISDIAEIGILLLLFFTGMDLDFKKFKEEIKPAAGVAAGGVILPFGLGYLAGILFGFSETVSLFIGASLVATSVGISASILHESGKIRSRIGTLIIDSAIMDDVVGIMLMTILFSLATTGSLKLWDLTFLVVFSILFFLVSLTFGITAMKKISQRIPIEKENLLLGGLIILLSFALITEKIGLAGIIGAFVAGIVVGQTQYSGPLTGSVSLIGEGFFIPIFFVYTGMQFNLNAFTSVGIFAIILIITAVGGKVIGSGLGAKIFGASDNEALATGIAMVPRAEVALIIANFGLQHGIIKTNIVSSIIVMIIITTIITPVPLWRTLEKIET